MVTKKQIQERPISKSTAMLAAQCPKYFWLHLFDPKLATEKSDDEKYILKQGDEVGELARELEGKGILIDAPFYDFTLTAKLTDEAIKKENKLLYEAGFLKNGLFVRADILKKTKKGWELIEVKSSTEIKEQYITDIAYQVFVIESSGLKLDRISIRYINKKMVYPNFDDFFITEEISKIVRAEIPAIKKLSQDIKKLLNKDSAPDHPIGKHCVSPYSCAFRDHCWKSYANKKTIFDLSVRSDIKWKIFDEGKILLKDVKANDYKGKLKEAIELAVKNKIVIDKKSVQKELATWQFPLYSFDFETLNPAIPLFKKTTPYTQVPFQFSVHILKNLKDKKFQHIEFLHTENSDPRPALIKAMLNALGDKGSIISYYKRFEIDRIRDLAEFDPKNRKKLLALIDRFVDPLPILQDSMFHPDFKGSHSLKVTAPVLLGEKWSYDNLAIGDGGSAQRIASEFIFKENSEGLKQEVIDDLLEYCKQDTESVLLIVKWLFSL